MQLSQTSKLSLFSLVMITVVSVDSIRNLPAAALFGSRLIFFFILAALLFLIPCALVSAELSASWREPGGVYRWVSKAFGPRAGLWAVWFQWIENVFWYPTMLSFIASTLIYLVDPQLSHHKWLIFSTVLACFWGTTLVNCFGIQASAMFSNICAVAGLLLPMTLIIALGALWTIQGHPVQLSFHAHDLLPSLSDRSTWIALVGVMLSCTGIEIATVHASDVDDPQRTFPRAIAIACAIIISTLVLGSLAIAAVVPHGEISLIAGIMQAFQAFLAAYGLEGWLPLIAVAIIIGGLGTVSGWIISPTRGLYYVATDGYLPTIFTYTNRFKAPVVLLILQAVVVSLCSAVFLFMSSLNASYWLLTALAASLYMMMYIMLFVTGIVLRKRYPNQESAFKVPGGINGLKLVSFMGILACLLTIVVSFIPPEQMLSGHVAAYEWTFAILLAIVIMPPFLLYRAEGKDGSHEALA